MPARGDFPWRQKAGCWSVTANLLGGDGHREGEREDNKGRDPGAKIESERDRGNKGSIIYASSQQILNLYLTGRLEFL